MTNKDECLQKIGSELSTHSLSPIDQKGKRCYIMSKPTLNTNPSTNAGSNIIFQRYVSLVWESITNSRNKRVTLYFLVLYFIHLRQSAQNSGLNFGDRQVRQSKEDNTFNDDVPLIKEKKHNILSLVLPMKNQYGYTTISTKELLRTTTSDPDFDALQNPKGYPFHRWTNNYKSMSGYPLNAEKFVSILRRMGQGEKFNTTLETGLHAERNFQDFDRLSTNAYPYIIQQGTVLRPFGNYKRWSVYKWHSQGHHIDWVTLLESAVSMAKSLEEKNPKMKLITQGEFPIIFDDFDYPWCCDDLVPVFRLSHIISEVECTHSWPSLSLSFILPQQSEWLKDTSDDWDIQHLLFNTQYPWQSKLPLAVWRGRYTGYRDIYPLGILPREQLVLSASSKQEIMDVHPVSWKYHRNVMTGKIVEAASNQILFNDFMKYKAVLDIDSNGASMRYGPLLCMNSAVIKVEPRFGSYWSHELEPWVHFIPVKSDLSDLKAQVTFAVADKNQQQVQRIVQNANKWCRGKMTWEQLTLDFLWSLLDYAELLDKAPTFKEKWKNDHSAHKLPNLKMARFKGELMISA